MLVGTEKQSCPAGVGAIATADEAGGNDFRVVEDQAVGRPQDFGQIADMTVLDLVARPIDEHQPGVAAFGQRMLGDELARQFEVVVGELGHRGNLAY